MEQQVKTCFKCGKTLPLDEFYVHPQMKDGHLNKCKVCTRKDVRVNRQKNIEYYREYDVKRFKTQQRKASVKKYFGSYHIKHHDKCISRGKFHRALLTHKIEKQPCEICGTTKNVQGHHEDYSKPLDVIWLCFKHHRWIHS